MCWIKVEDVILLHRLIIKKSGGLDGVRDLEGLESAVFAPLQTFEDKELFPTELEKIARLGFGLASNHAFVDGNKRIGALVMQIMLKENGYNLVLQEDELADLYISVASGETSEKELLLWIQRHLK